MLESQLPLIKQIFHVLALRIDPLNLDSKSAKELLFVIEEVEPVIMLKLII